MTSTLNVVANESRASTTETNIPSPDQWLYRVYLNSLTYSSVYWANEKVFTCFVFYRIIRELLAFFLLSINVLIIHIQCLVHIESQT